MFEDFVDGGVLTLSAEATSIWEEVNDRNTEYLNTSWAKMEDINPIASKRDRILLRFAAVLEVLFIHINIKKLHFSRGVWRI